MVDLRAFGQVIKISMNQTCTNESTPCMDEEVLIYRVNFGPENERELGFLNSYSNFALLVAFSNFGFGGKLQLSH